MLPARTAAAPVRPVDVASVLRVSRRGVLRAAKGGGEERAEPCPRPAGRESRKMAVEQLPGSGRPPVPSGMADGRIAVSAVCPLSAARRLRLSTVCSRRDGRGTMALPHWADLLRG